MRLPGQALILAWISWGHISRNVPHRLLSLLCFLACGAVAALEPVVATPYEVRHEVQELLDDLANQRGDKAALIDRVQVALIKHGDLLLVRSGAAMPIAETLTAALKTAGLEKDFIQIFSPVAERRLANLTTAHASADELRRLALGYPGTTAARAAWRMLADRAWDAGALAAFSGYARLAQDESEPRRSPRLTAASALALPASGSPPPTNLRGIEELWRFDMGEPTLESRPKIRRSPAGDHLEIVPGFDELSALCDGYRLCLFDHVIGRVQGEIHLLGNLPLSSSQIRPVVLRDGFAALGILDEQVHVVALDLGGRVRWQQSLISGDRSVVSSLVRIDDLVAFASATVTRNGADLGADLHVIALHADTGKKAWDALVARLPASRPMAMMVAELAAAPPSLALVGDALVLCANDGLLARISAHGAVQRVWSYPSIYDDLNTLVPARAGARSGTIISDGRTAVAAPADSPGTILVMNPGDDLPRPYTGDNASGEVVDVRDGVALLVGRRATLIDLSTLRPRWTIPLEGDGPLRGCLGEGRVLLAGRGRMTLLNASDGSLLAQRDTLDKALSLAVVDDAMVIVQGWNVQGLGRGESFLERLSAAAAKEPNDYRPLIALASLFEARDDRSRAFDCLEQALGRGAPQEYAERGARLVRRDLELAAGNILAFPPMLARMERIAKYERRLDTELSWWRGRHAELTGNRELAATQFRAVLAAPPRHMQLASRLEADAHTLAACALARLGAAATPAWCGDISIPKPDAKPGAPWQLTCHPSQRFVLADEWIVGLNDGLLSARRLINGSEVWWRQPGRALLGVTWQGLFIADAEADVDVVGENNQPADPVLEPNLNPPPRNQQIRGLMVEVLPGSAADAAGMRTGDRLLALNDKPTTDFERDLRSVVTAMSPRTPFTLDIERGKERKKLHGTLGGELVEPIASGNGLVLLWPLTFLPGPGTRSLSPEGMWFSAHELASGRELWRWSLPPISRVPDHGPIAPLLTAQGLVITQDGGDVVALDSTRLGPEGPAVRWRLSGAASGLAHLRHISPQLLWLPLGGQNRIGLVDLETGTMRFLLPVSAGATALVDHGEIVLRDSDGKMALWDLTLARQRWRGESCIALLAFSGDGLLVLDDKRRPVLIDRINGSRRRVIDDWTIIEDWQVSADTVLVHGRREGRQSLASIAIPGATVRWEAFLPQRAEIKTLFIGADSTGCVIGDDHERDSILLFDASGTPRSALRLNPGETMLALLSEGGVLLRGPNSLRCVSATLPVPPAALPAPVAEPAGDLATTAVAVLPRLIWQEVGKARYAVAHCKNALLLFADLPPGSPPLEILVSDAAPAIEAAGAPVRFTPDGPIFTALLGSWRFGGTARLDAPQGTRRDCVRLDPPPERLPAAPLTLRAACGTATDAAEAPWWLHRAWREIR